MHDDHAKLGSWKRHVIKLRQQHWRHPTHSRLVRKPPLVGDRDPVESPLTLLAD